MREFINIIYESQEEPLTREDLIESVIEEADIPSTAYGYWITDTGEIEPVDHMHVTTLYDLGIHESLLRAMRAGWIRLVADHPILYIDMHVGCATPRALASLRRLATSEGFDNFVLDLEYDSASQAIMDADPKTRDELYQVSGSGVFKDIGSLMRRLNLALQPA
jgi:hypothetical protein